MQYNVQDLVKEVRFALDNNNSSEPLLQLGDVSTLSINEIIESKIADAARIILQEAPVPLLGEGSPISGKIYWPSGEIGKDWGHILLPDNFLRLLCFQMSDWDISVSKTIDENSPQYALQKSRYNGIKGNPQKPVVAIVSWGTGLHLEFYSCSAGSNISVRKARYIAIPKIEAGKITFSEKLKSAIVYYTAFMVAQELSKDENFVKSLLEQAKELIK